MQQRLTRRITFGILIFEIQQIIPSDFEDGKIPFWPFLIEKKQTNYDKIMAKMESEKEVDPKAQLEAIRWILKSGISGCFKRKFFLRVKEKFDVENFLNTSPNLALALGLCGAILELSFSKLEVRKISLQYAEKIDLLAKRYGCLPSELFWPNGGATPCDKFSFNMTIGMHCRNAEISRVQKEKYQVVYSV